MDILNETLLKLKRLEGEVERLKTIEQPVTAIGGWLEIPDGSWTYASATTITVPSGAASIYAVGDQVRLKQGGAYKYFYVTAVADTTLTVTGGSDYNVANAAITDAAFSKGGGVGHPGSFAYNAIISATTGTITAASANAHFLMCGREVFVDLYITITTNGTGSGGVVASIPISSAGVFVISGREIAVKGIMLSGTIANGETDTKIYDYNNNYPGGDGYILLLSGTYRI